MERDFICLSVEKGRKTAVLMVVRTGFQNILNIISVT